MSQTQLFCYEATVNETLISSTIESSSIVEALRLVNNLHQDAEQITVAKIQENHAELHAVTD
jgi:hypothetical protein